MVGGCWKRENKRKNTTIPKDPFSQDPLSPVKLMVRNKSVKKRMQNAFLVNVFVNGNIHAIQVAFHKNKNLQTCSTWTLFPSTQKTPPVVTGVSILFIIHPPQICLVYLHIQNDFFNALACMGYNFLLVSFGFCFLKKKPKTKNQNKTLRVETVFVFTTLFVCNAVRFATLSVYNVVRLEPVSVLQRCPFCNAVCVYKTVSVLQRCRVAKELQNSSLYF